MDTHDLLPVVEEIPVFHIRHSNIAIEECVVGILKLLWNLKPFAF